MIALKAYAKVNLSLDIVGRRADNYHLLKSVMQSVSLADTIILKRKSDFQQITLQSDHPVVPLDESNICWRAAKSFQTYTGLGDLSVEITLKKKIPVAAGLGGGSANAAAVLFGLNKLYKTGLSLEKLQEIGLSVGADIPFCLQGGTCLVEGIGEKVTPIKPFPQIPMVLVKPAASVSTAQVFGKLDRSFYGGNSTNRLLKFIDSGKDLTADLILENALESVTTILLPEVDFWKRKLVDHGAISSLMSGSGPVVFGLFTSGTLAQEFCDRFQDKQGAELFAVTLMHTGVSEMNGGNQL